MKSRTFNISPPFMGLCVGLFVLLIVFHGKRTKSVVELAADKPIEPAPCGAVSNLLDDPMMDNLAAFSAGSANDGHYKQLWIEGAGLFIPLMNELLVKTTDYGATWRTCQNYNKNDAFTQNLAALFDSHGSDKANAHDYYKVYGAILQELGVENPLYLLEVGMGTNNSSLISSMGASGKPGASLRSFRDALPHARIYGADIDENILFTENRIETFQVDQMKRASFEQLGANNRMFDLIIDDGLHSTAGNLNTLLWAMEHTNKGGYVVIEDIHDGHTENWKVIDFILTRATGWEAQLVDCNLGNLFVLRKLH